MEAAFRHQLSLVRTAKGVASARTWRGVGISQDVSNPFPLSGGRGHIACRVSQKTADSGQMVLDGTFGTVRFQSVLSESITPLHLHLQGVVETLQTA
jgi:hypothetical protein